jgi:hypothetical protein
VRAVPDASLFCFFEVLIGDDMTCVLREFLQIYARAQRKFWYIPIMKSDTIKGILGGAKPTLNFYTSDGRIVYVDHPESVIVGEQLVAIGSGADGSSGVVRDIILLSPDHIVRIEPTKRKPLRRLA